MVHVRSMAKNLHLFTICTFIVGCFSYSSGDVPFSGCNPQHCTAGTKFHFESGWSYVYSYEANVVTSIGGTSNDFSGIFVEAQAEIYAVRSCQLRLKLRNVELRSRDVDNPAPMHFASGHAEFKEALEEKVAYFSFVDGVVGSVCCDAEEKPWVLNIKRSVISAFQNSAQSFYRSSHITERDVQGDCPTDYETEFGFSSVTVKKTKNLEHCQQRHRFMSGIQSTPYTSPKGSPVSPVLDSSYECKQTIEDGIVQRISCVEIHLLKPFSSGESGAQTRSQLTLVLIDQLYRPASLRIEEPPNAVSAESELVVSSILFDHDYRRPNLTDTVSALVGAESMLSKLCYSSSSDMQHQAPQLFWQLRDKLQALDYASLVKVYGDVDRICNFSPRGQKVFHDVLPMVGTLASVILMRDFITERSVPEEEIDYWLSILAFHPRPTYDVIKEVLPLVTSTTTSAKTLLTLSALVHSFCHREDVSDCDNYHEIKSFWNLIKDRLGHHCRTESLEENKWMVVTLKVVGNLGLSETETPITLERCALEAENTVSVRLAAINAYRRFSCHISRDHFMHIFRNREEDVEVRIAAYLALMKCPTENVIHEIREILESEKVNQVNSFVWSHLDVLARRSDPGAIFIASILDDVVLSDKYASDVRKFSKAFGTSALSEILNVGANIDGGVVYSPSAFLPRSIYLNLTVHLYGQSINLFELDGRVQGLERLAEAFFRPDPPLDTYSGSDGEGPVHESNRLNEITERFHALGKIANAVGDREIAVSAKVFGQEVWLSHAITDEIDGGVHRLTSLTWMDILELLSADNSIELSRDSVLIDLVYAVPSLAGLPLLLNLNATASVHVKSGGRLDIRQMGIGVCDIEGQLRPSGIVAIQGSMLVDGYVGRSGVKLDASLSTSTVLDGKLKLTSQGQVKVQINMPVDKVEFIKASTNLILTRWSADGRLRGLSAPNAASSHRRCSTEFTHRPLGIALCVQMNYVNASSRLAAPYYPLTGSSLFDLYLIKTDPKLTSYFLEYVWHISEVANSTDVIMFSFRTPRSAEDREWTVSYSLNRMDKSVLARFLTPLKKVMLKGRYFDDPSRRGILASVDVDGHEAFSFHSELSSDMKDEDQSYQPKIIIRVPTHTVLELDGLVRYNPFKRNLHVDLSLEKFTLQPIVFRGEASSSASGSHSRYECSLDSPVLNFSLKGSLNAIDGGLSSKANLDYQLLSKRRRETIAVTTKLRYSSPVGRATTSLSTTIDVHLSAAPEYDVIIVWEYQSADGHLENTLIVDRPGDGDVVKAQIARFQQILSYNGTLEHNSVLSKVELKFPSRDMFLLMVVDHQNTLHSLHSKMSFRGGTGKEYGFEVRIEDGSVDTWMTTGLLRLVADGRESAMSLSVAEERSTDLAPVRYVLKADCYGRLFGDANISLNYTNESQRFVFKHFAKLDVVGVTVDVHAVADLLLTHSRGLLSVDADVDGEKYRLNGDYLRLNVTEHDFAVSMRSSLPGRHYACRFKVSTGLEKSVTFAVRSGPRSRVEGVASLLLTHEVRAAACHLAWNAEVVPYNRSFNVSVRRENYVGLTHTQFDAAYMKDAAVLQLEHLQQGSFAAGLYDQTTKVSANFSNINSLDVDVGFHYSCSKDIRELAGSLRSFTPTLGIKKLLLNANHTDDGRSWKSQSSFDVNDKFPLKLVSSGKSWTLANQGHTEAAVELVTPIVDFDHLSITITHDLASRETRTKLRAQWTGRVEPIILEAHAVRPDPKSYDFFTGTADLTTPFVDYRHLRLGVGHTHTTREIHSQAYWSHDGENLFCLAVHGDVGIKGHYYEVVGNVTLLTPLEDFNKIIATLSHSHDSHALRTDLVMFGSNSATPLTVRLEASRSRPLLFNLEAVRQSDFAMKLGGHWNSGGSGSGTVRSGLLLDGGLHARWNELMANSTVSGAYNSVADFRCDAAVVTSMTGAERTSLSVHNHIKTQSIESHFKVDLMGSSMAAAIVNARWDTPLRLNVTVQLDTPFPLAENVILSVIHVTADEQSRPHRTSLRAVWNDLSSSLDNSAVFHGGFNFQDVLLLSLPSEEWSGLALSINHSTNIGIGTTRSFLHLHQYDVPILSGDVDVLWSVEEENRRRLIGHVNLFSPFDKWKQINISFDHVDDGVEYKPVVVWNSANFDSPIVVTGYAKSSTSGKVFRLDVKSSIIEYESLGLSAMYSLQDTEIEWAASAQWRNFTRIEVDGLFIIDLMMPRLKLAMQTPIPGYTTLKLDGKYDVWSLRKESSIVVVKEDWTMQMFGSGIFQEDFVDTQLSMKTSAQGSELVVHFNISGQWNPDDKMLRTILLWGPDDSSMSVSVRLLPSAEGASVTASLNMNLGSNQRQNATLSIGVRHAKPDDVECKVLASWGRADSVDFQYRMRTSDNVPLNYSLFMSSTTPVIPHVAVKIVVLKSDAIKQRQIEANFQANEQHFYLLSDLAYGHGVNFIMKLQTPLELLQNVSLLASISSDDAKSGIYRVVSDLSLSEGNTSISGTLQKPAFSGQSSTGILKFSSAGHRPVTSAVEFRISDLSLDASIKSDPPLAPLRDLVSADVHYHWTHSEFVVKAFADVSDGQHAVIGRASRHSGFLAANATVKSTALKGSYDDVLLDASLIASSNGTFVSVFDGQETHSLELLLQDPSGNDEVKYEFKANSSLFARNCSPSVTSNNGIHFLTGVSKIADGFHGIVDVSSSCSGRSVANLSYEIEPNAGVVILFVDVATPLESFRRFKIDAGHRGKNWGNMDTHLQLVTPITGYEKLALALKTERSTDTAFNIDVFVDTPFQGFESISLSERLIYDDRLVSKTDLVYDGFVADLEVHHFRTSDDRNMSIGVDGHWRMRDPYSEIMSNESIKPKRASIRFGWLGPKYFLDYVLHGTLWGFDGSWNYTSWRFFTGNTAVSRHRSAGSEVLYGIRTTTYFPTSSDTDGSGSGQLGVQWAAQKSFLINYFGLVSASRFEGSFNMTGPLLAILGDGTRFVDCHLVTVKGSRSIVGSATVKTDRVVIADATLEWVTDVTNVWRNRTVALNVDNVFQPLGIAVAVSRRSSIYWMLDSSVQWNLTRRDLGQNSVNLLLESNAASRRLPESTFHVHFLHPRHQADLRIVRRMTDNNATVSVVLLRGSDRLKEMRPVTECKAWRVIHAKGAKLNAGVKWSYPGRTLLATATHDLVLRTPKRTATELGFWWDIDSHPDRSLLLHWNYNDASAADGNHYAVNAVLRSPRLRKEVILNANVSIGAGSKFFDAALELDYSQDPRDLLLAAAMLSFTEPNVHVFHGHITHRNVKLNSTLDGSWTRGHLSGTRASANFTLYWLNNVDGRNHESCIKTSLLADPKNFSIQFANSDDSSGAIQMFIERDDLTNEFRTFVVSSNANNRSVTLHKVTYKSIDPSLDADFAYSPGNVLQLKAGLQSSSLGSVLIARRGEEADAQLKGTPDFSFTIRLNTSRLVFVHCNWTENAIKDLQDAVGQSLGESRNRVLVAFGSVWKASVSELIAKSRLIVRSLATRLQPIAEEASFELEVIEEDMQSIVDHLENMYDDNDFLMQDIILFLDKWNDYIIAFRKALSEVLPFSWNPLSVSHWMEDVLQKLDDVLTLFISSWYKWSEKKLAQSVEIFSRLLAAAHDAWSVFGRRLYASFAGLRHVMSSVTGIQSTDISVNFASLSNIGDWLSSVWSRVKSIFASVQKWIAGRLEFIVSWMFNNDVYVYIYERIASTMAAIRHFLSVQVFDYMDRFLMAIKPFMSAEQQKLMDALQSTLLAFREAILAMPSSFAENAAFDEIADLATTFYHKVIWIFHYYELLPSPWRALFSLYSEITYLFSTKMEVATKRFDSPNYILVDSENRKFELVQTLPFPWTSLRKFPRFGQTDELRYIRRLWESFQAAESDSRITLPASPTVFVPSIFVWWNDVTNRLDARKWLPPFRGYAFFIIGYTARAMLIGHQHYVSFDDQITDFTGPCSYLLTHDFVDSNFTASINYNGGTTSDTQAERRSLSIWLDGREIELLFTAPRLLQVYVDGRKVELPQHLGLTNIVRDVHRLTVEYAYGFVVSCHLQYDVCTFAISGWYLGRVGGLLGTYNYESSDDVRLPDGSVSELDLNKWGREWQIEASENLAVPKEFCVAPRNWPTVSPRKDSPVFSEHCMEYFNSSRSTFRLCFTQIDPTPYFQMCMSDVQSDDTPQAMCMAAAAYVDRCLSETIPVRMPKLCVRCHLSDGSTMTEGDSRVVQSANNSKRADVVFIIEAKKCNRKLPSIYVDFVAAIDAALIRANVHHRRFATVTFGGSGFHNEPRIHTVDSEIFVGQRVISGLPNLVFGRGSTTVFDAFRFAAKLPFEAGASKTFVLLACSIGDDVEMKIDYPEVHWLLLEDGITLHLLLDHEFETKRPNTFYGMDGQRAYTSKDARSRELKGDEDLRRQVAPPKDVHVPIALEVNGTVFSSARLYGPLLKLGASSDTSTRSAAVKRFLDVFSRRLAQSASADVCHFCECFPADHIDVGRLYCYPCVYPKPAYVYVGPDEESDDDDVSSLLKPGTLDKVKAVSNWDSMSGGLQISTSDENVDESSTFDTADREASEGKATNRLKLERN